MNDDHSAVEASILENVRLGYMEFAGIRDDGTFEYRLTEKGKRRAEALIEGRDPDV